jgi:ketosteroid isomerase-like protein
MSTSEAIAVVRKLFEAVAHRDPAEVFGAYHPDIVISEAPSLPYGGEYRGREGAIRHAEGFRSTWDRYQPEAIRNLEPEFLALGDRVIVLWRFRAQGETRGSIDLPVVSIYRLREGRIVESRMLHFDTAALLQFLDNARTDEVADPRTSSEKTS